MQHLQDIPLSFLSTQTCVNCRLWITCSPVYVINDLSMLCGRCRMTAKDHYRNFAYEALAHAFLYPCKNWKNHCSMKLEWNESLSHEMECSYDGCCTLICCHPGAFFKGHRDIPNDEPKWVMVPENYLDELECVMCGGYLSSAPIFLQSNGCNVCHRCIYNSGNPPNCRRNFAYENYAHIFLFPCSYKKRGCKERLPFGKAIWQHESQCEYGPDHQRKIMPSSQTSGNHRKNQQNRQESGDTKPIKEKGLVKTHVGHVWATITPQKALFAPPDDPAEDQANRELMKSLAKKYEKQRRTANEIENDLATGRRNSETESISTNESLGVKSSGYSTPDHLKRPYDNRRSPSEYTRTNSTESGGYPPPAQFPVMQPHQLNDMNERLGSLRRASYRESLKRESVQASSTLINELKLKQDQIKRTHSIKTERPNGVVYRPPTGNLQGINEDYNRPYHY